MLRSVENFNCRLDLLTTKFYAWKIFHTFWKNQGKTKLGKIDFCLLVNRSESTQKKSHEIISPLKIVACFKSGRHSENMSKKSELLRYLSGDGGGGISVVISKTYFSNVSIKKLA